MTPPVSLEPGYSDEGLAMGEYDRVVVIVWRGKPTRRRLERCVEEFAAIVSRTPGRYSMMVVIEERSPPPDLVDLAFSANELDRFAAVLVASVVVLEERSTTSALLDAVARVHAQRRRPTPAKFCVDGGEGATWLASRHPHSDPDGAAFRAGLVTAIEQVRALLPR